MQNDTHQIIAYCIYTVKIVRVSDQYRFYFYFREMEQIRYIMCYWPLNDDDQLILVMFYIEISCIIFFHNYRIGNFLVFFVTFFETVKELHKL